MTIFRLKLSVLITVFILSAGVFALVPGQAQNMSEPDTSVPEMPEPIAELVNQGAQVRFLGRDYGLDAWLTIKNGQEQYFYVLPDKSAFLMGVLFDNKGKLVTVQQVKKLQSQGETLMDQLADGFADAGDQAANSTSKAFDTPSERLYNDIENSNWLPLGQVGAPVLYAFIDPQCPHCHEFINDLRKDYIDKGKMQLRMIPIGFKEETVAQAAYLLAAPDPQARWYRHMEGDKDALPAKTEINQQGVQRNLAIMHSWKFDVTPLIIYRARDNSVKIIKGRPKDLPALINDLGMRV
jgi:thiol:disulfide interchange protein DsbG